MDVVFFLTRRLRVVSTSRLTPGQRLRLHDRLGSLEAGKLADVLAVKGDPLKDLGTLEQVRFVMKAGRVVLDARAGEGQAEGSVR